VLEKSSLSTSVAPLLARSIKDSIRGILIFNPRGIRPDGLRKRLFRFRTPRKRMFCHRFAALKHARDLADRISCTYRRRSAVCAHVQ